jgi:beta-lactamase regulating signal transducer with metallopeptidase domain
VRATELLDALWTWCVPALLQGTLLLGCAWLADRCLARRVWSECLSVLWWLAFARFFLPPRLHSPLSVTTEIGVATLDSARSTPSTALLAVLGVLHVAVFAALLLLRARRRARLAQQIEFIAAPGAWHAAVERLAGELGCRIRPRIGVLDGLVGPAVFGLARPVLLVPRAWLTRAPTRRDEHALLHELAHVARRDAWLDEAVALLRALLWFHPLAWYGARRLRELAELQCDQAVARALGAESRAYRGTLALAARHLLGTQRHTELCGFLGRRSAVLERLERLEHRVAGSRRLVRCTCAAAALLLGACVLPMAPRATFHVSPALLADARAVFQAQRDGQPTSCFHLQAAALVLAADPSH